MSRLTVLLAVACAATALLSSTASAATKTCRYPKDPYQNVVATNVSCKRAKSVIRMYFAGDKSPYGYTCKPKQFPGGVTTTCRKGDRRVVHHSAD